MKHEIKESILIVDDDEQLSEVLALSLEAEGYGVVTHASSVPALRELARTDFSLVLLDLRLGEENGLDILPRIREIDSNVPVLMITAHGDVDSAVDAFRFGGNGYIRKPFQEGLLKSQISQSIEAFRLKRQLLALRLQTKDNDVRSIFRSRDPIMEPVLKRIAIAAQVNSNVVVTGESGTGKELAARALHACGPRSSGPFVAFNCAALPETLLESELFGHMKGAFTDARENKPGLFVRANGGTLFLDEIGDAPLSIQSKLLRVIQEREVLPLGGRAPIKVDVRMIAATHRSLQQEVAAGRFRQDLYYRLQVVPIHLPPLRERKKDILFLASIFATKLASQLGVSFDGFSSLAAAALENHTWSGNVRELQNRVEYALVLGRGGKISARSLFPEQPERPEPNDYLEIDEEEFIIPLPAPADSSEPILPFKAAKQSFEKNYLVRILNEAKGNVAKAARLASKSRAELYGLVKKHGLDPGEFKDRAR